MKIQKINDHWYIGTVSLNGKRAAFFRRTRESVQISIDWWLEDQA